MCLSVLHKHINDMTVNSASNMYNAVIKLLTVSNPKRIAITSEWFLIDLSSSGV